MQKEAVREIEENLLFTKNQKKRVFWVARSQQSQIHLMGQDLIMVTRFSGV